jgi:FMN-dependent NADH-azoreductase
MSLTILQIDSSPLGDRSVSRKFTAALVSGLLAKHPGATLVTHDFGAAPLPHLDATTIAAFFTPPDQRSPELAAAVKRSDWAANELLAADIIVVGAPMWNFGLPSGLKAWIDHVVRAGITFRYTETGPVGLVPPGKKVYIVSSRGGIYSDGPFKPYDHQETYLQAIFGFMGFHDVTVIRAEGLAYGEAAVAQALEVAGSQVAASLAA